MRRLGGQLRHFFKLTDNSTDSGTEHCWAFKQKKGKKEN